MNDGIKFCSNESRIILFSFRFFLQELQLFDKIEWIGNGPPIAEPQCGFRGEKCISKYSLQSIYYMYIRMHHLQIISGKKRKEEAKDGCK